MPLDVLVHKIYYVYYKILLYFHNSSIKNKNRWDGIRMSCFTVQLKPFDPIDRNVRTTITRFQASCIRANIFGMGFHIPEIFANQTKSLNISEYGSQYEDKYLRDHRVRENPEWRRSFSRTIHTYQRIRAGNFVLTRLFNTGECYIGKTISEPFYNKDYFKNFDFAGHERFSWIVPVELWKPLGNIYDGNIDVRIRDFLGFPYIVPTISRLPEAEHDTFKAIYLNIQST